LAWFAFFRAAAAARSSRFALRLPRSASTATAFCSENCFLAALAAIFFSQLVPTTADL
jgi:hypothetical protein